MHHVNIDWLAIVKCLFIKRDVENQLITLPTLLDNTLVERAELRI